MTRGDLCSPLHTTLGVEHVRFGVEVVSHFKQRPPRAFLAGILRHLAAVVSPFPKSCVIAPAMAASSRDSIVLMSSLSSLRGNKTIGAYGLTKAALVQLARNLAVEWGPSGLRTNAVSPGLVETSFAAPLMANPEFLRKRLALTPLRRVGQPEEIATVVHFLLSEASSFVTGHNLVADGGTIISDGN